LREFLKINNFQITSYFTKTLLWDKHYEFTKTICCRRCKKWYSMYKELYSIELLKRIM